MISTNYSINSIGFTGFLKTGREPLKRVAEEVAKKAEVSSSASKSSRCILKGKSSEVVEKVEKGINKKGFLKTGVPGTIY